MIGLVGGRGWSISGAVVAMEGGDGRVLAGCYACLNTGRAEKGRPADQLLFEVLAHPVVFPFSAGQCASYVRPAEGVGGWSSGQNLIGTAIFEASSEEREKQRSISNRWHSKGRHNSYEDCHRSSSLMVCCHDGDRTWCSHLDPSHPVFHFGDLGSQLPYTVLLFLSSRRFNYLPYRSSSISRNHPSSNIPEHPRTCLPLIGPL